MKRTYAIMSLLVVLILTTFVFGQTITKGLIGKEDFSLHATDNGAAETFTRATSTGATITLTKIAGNHFVWDNTYTRTIRPKTITGNSTGAISGYTTITAATGLSSGGTLSVTGNSTLSGTLTVTGATVLNSTLSSTSLTTGTGTFSGDIAANGDITGDGATIVSGIARYKMDGYSFDTGTAAPTSGTWSKGDWVWNVSPTAKTTIAATGAIGWRCTTGGTPGTWEAVFPVFTATPDNAAVTCTAGMRAIDASYIYACVSANTWKRVGITTW